MSNETDVMVAAGKAFETDRHSAGSWSNLQDRLAAWQGRNFGAMSALQMTLGVCEEAGELAHAVLKESQGIRGMQDRDTARAAVADALGDIIIYAFQVATLYRLDLGTVVGLTAANVMRRDWVKNPDGEAK